MPDPSTTQDQEFLRRFLLVVERIATTGDIKSVPSLLEMTNGREYPPLFTSLAEAFARMVVKLEAREFLLECVIADMENVKRELELANYDPLTRLPNRIIARDRLHQALALARKSSKQAAVFYLDLDRFKWVNDNLGHAAGDDLLCQVAQRMRDCVRLDDTVARLGGDEFLCVVPDIEKPVAAKELARRILEAIGQPFRLRAGEISIGVSIGIAFFPEHGESSDLLIACADKALYQAKSDGRNVYRIFASPPAT
jgi:diguanylate cyclase (GGDEF)-like protein